MTTALIAQLASLSGTDARFAAGTGALLNTHWVLTCAHIALQPLGRMFCNSAGGMREVEAVYLEGSRHGDGISQIGDREWTDSEHRFEKLALLRLADAVSTVEPLQWKGDRSHSPYVTPVRRDQTAHSFESFNMAQFHEVKHTSCLASSERFEGPAMPVRCGDSGAPVFQRLGTEPRLFAILNCLMRFSNGYRAGVIPVERARDWWQALSER